MAKSRSDRRRAKRSAAKASTDTQPIEEGFPEENAGRPREYHGRRTMVTAVAVVGAIALAIFLAFGTEGSAEIEGDLGIVAMPDYLNPSGARVAASVDDLAPDFELETLDGERFRLSDLRGHPVILNFWASWCGPCRAETPVLVRLAQRFEDQGLVVIGVNIEESRGSARDFTDEFSVPYSVPMDFGGSVTDRYFAGSGPPHTFFLGPHGTIEQVFRGQGPDDAFEQVSARILALLETPVGPGLLAGPKAVPTDRLIEDRPVGNLIGQIAPDFVLHTPNSSIWRLTTVNRLQPVLLVLIPPGCRDCTAQVEAASLAAGQVGVEVAVIAEEYADGQHASLLWREDVASLYDATISLQLILMGQNGVITVRGDTSDALLSALAELTPDAAGTPTS
jgi:peroxiredoxin